MKDKITIDGVKYVREEKPVKKVAREFWIEFGCSEFEYGYVPDCSLHDEEPYINAGYTKIHVREVLPGEVTITKERFTEVLQSTGFDIRNSKSLSFIMDKMGFKE